MVIIKLKNKMMIEGNLQNFDQHLNLILTDCKDVTESNVKNLNKIILRGDNITMVSLQNNSNSLKQKDDDSI